MGVGIEQRRHQDVFLAVAGALRVFERVRDHADRQTAAVAAAVPRLVIDPGPVRAARATP